MSELDSKQKVLAYEMTEGFVLVDAGPGTGKTTTLVERYLNLLSKGVDPSEILMLTFTNNAAAEMEKRIRRRMYLDGSDLAQKAVFVEARTFDSFCNSIVSESSDDVLEQFGIDIRMIRSSELIGEDKANIPLFGEIAKDFEFEHRDEDEAYGYFPKAGAVRPWHVLKIIMKLMSFGIIPKDDGSWFGVDAEKILCGEDPDTDDQYGDRDRMLRYIHDIYLEYIRTCIDKGAMTYGLNALTALMMLYSDSGVRQRNGYRYVMIDEFQDTSTIQLMIALMVMREPNLCVIGDWKQGIYEFRDASIDNILEFREKVADACAFLNRGERRISFDLPEDIGTVDFESNYRSSQKIIDASFKALLIKASGESEIEPRFIDNIVQLKAKRDEISDCTSVRIMDTGQKPENENVADCIEEYVRSDDYVIRECDHGNVSEKQLSYDNISVLCRTGRQCTLVYDCLSWRGIPAFIQGDVDVIASTAEGKMVLCWLKVLDRTRFKEYYLHVMELEKCSRQQVSALENGPQYVNSPPMGICSAISALRVYKHNPVKLVSKIFERYEVRTEYAQSIINTVADRWSGTMMTFPELVDSIRIDALFNEKYEIDPPNGDRAVKIMTMHKSKGLEFETVIIPYMDSYLKRPGQSKGDEEEYVPNFVYSKRNGIVCTLDDDLERIDGISETIADDTAHDEDRRLLFVAMSRAKQYLTVTYREDKKDTEDDRAFRTGLECLIDDAEREIRPADHEPFVIPLKRSERPVLEIGRRRIVKLTPHDIMSAGIKEKDDSVHGLGVTHGVIVHENAELMANGLEPVHDGMSQGEYENVNKVIGHMDGAELFTEIPCRYPVPGTNVLLSGTIDLLCVSGGRIEIHDYKTDAPGSINAMKVHDEYRLQLSVYAYAAMEYFGTKDVKCFVDYVSQGPISIREIELIPLETIRNRCLRKARGAEVIEEA